MSIISKINPFKGKGKPEIVEWMLPTIYPLLTTHQKREVREQYVAEQQGLCYHCRKSLAMEPTAEMKQYSINWDAFPDGFMNHPVHLHHDHNTELTIGAVHAFCNAVLWQYHGE